MNSTKIRTKKVNAIRKNKAPSTIDLFSGCGGLSLGFFSAGFRILGGIENNPEAIRSHALNFHQADNNEFLSKSLDITKISPVEYVKEIYDQDEPDKVVDAIIGGPPCQAFARVGRAKLREVAEHPEAFKLDPRAELPLQYLRYVGELNPVILVMENVIDILNFGGYNLAEDICGVLDTMGYNCRYSILNAVFYGVPQMRERFFLIAFAKEFNILPDFPKPTHWIDLPNGYNNARSVALKTNSVPRINKELIKSDEEERPQCYWVYPPVSTPDLLPAITAQDAICDLPEIFDHLKGKMRRGVRKLDNLIEYPMNKPQTDYSILMRNWPGFENNIGIVDHVIRYLPRDYAIFKVMKAGDQYPEAHQTAIKIFNKKITSLKKVGHFIEKGSEEYEQLWKEIVPPYDPGKFPNKWRKMESDKPARTLMAHLGKDGYSHIHYDSKQARTISVREAARLQSFPDGFRFVGAMNSAFRQIGNAVPPLLAKCIAEKILISLRNPKTLGYSIIQHNV